MARIRTIKPEFFLDDDIAALHPLTRMLFVGLWCLADKCGRLEDKPQRIKIQILPYDDHDVDSALDELASSCFICRYDVEERKYIQIKSFEKHQRISGKELQTQSTIPEAPVKRKGSTGEASEKHRGSIREASETTGKERKGKEGKGKDQEGGVGETETEKHLPVDNSNPMTSAPELLKTENETTEDPDDLSKYDPPKQTIPQPKKQIALQDRWTEPTREELETLMSEINQRYGARYHQQCLIWMQKNLMNKNPDAIVFCLRYLITKRLAGKSVEHPRQWLEAALADQEVKFNNKPGNEAAAAHDREAQVYKKPIGAVGMATIGAIFQQAGQAQ